VKHWFDSIYSSNRNIEVGDLVLKWDKAHEDKGEHSKFYRLWIGPFIVTKKIGRNTFCLQTLEVQLMSFDIATRMLQLPRLPNLIINPGFVQT